MLYLSTNIPRYPDHDPSIDVDPGAIPPEWPPDPTSMMIDDAVYDYRDVTFASISMVTDRIVKVNIPSIL